MAPRAARRTLRARMPLGGASPSWSGQCPGLVAMARRGEASGPRRLFASRRRRARPAGGGRHGCPTALAVVPSTTRRFRHPSIPGISPAIPGNMPGRVVYGPVRHLCVVAVRSGAPCLGPGAVRRTVPGGTGRRRRPAFPGASAAPTPVVPPEGTIRLQTGVGRFPSTIPIVSAGKGRAPPGRRRLGRPPGMAPAYPLQATAAEPSRSTSSVRRRPALTPHRRRGRPGDSDPEPLRRNRIMSDRRRPAIVRSPAADGEMARTPRRPLRARQCPGRLTNPSGGGVPSAPEPTAPGGPPVRERRGRRPWPIEAAGNWASCREWC